MAKIARAVLSCHDKRGVVELAQFLRGFGVELICTAGTLRVLKEAGIESRSIADFTGVPEMMDGRVKSLHPRIHAGLLGIRDRKLHVEQMQEYDLQWIDMVVVNLHPIEQFIQDASLRVDDVVEQIDIGGVAMLRSAAKNFRYVSVVVNPERYTQIMHEMRAHEGEIPYMTRFKLAQEAFACSARYDEMLAAYLGNTSLPEGSQ